MNRRAVLVLLPALAVAAAASATEYTNSVLDLGVGARPLGMGGAGVATVDDSTSTYWNPAGLTGVQHFEITAAEQGHQSSALSLGANDVGSDYFFMSGGMTLPQVGSFGLSVMRFGVSGIPQVQNTTPDPNNGPYVLGTFGSSDYGVFLSYAHHLTTGLDGGLTIKTLFGGTNGLVADATNGISGNANYNYAGLDLGVKVHFEAYNPSLEGLVFGLNAQDLLNTGVHWSGTGSNPSESVNPNPKLGLAYSLPFDFLKQMQSTFTLAADVDPSVYSPSLLFHYGAEFWYKDTLAFRGGLMQFTNSLQQNEASLGASIKISILQVDYSYIYYTLTPIQYLDLAVRF